MCPHFQFWFPSCFLHTVMLPKHLYQRDLLVPQLLYFTIRNNFWLSSKVKSSCTCTSCTDNMCDSSSQYFRSTDTWNTSCNLANSGGSTNRYVTSPILSKTSYGPLNLGLSYPFFPNLSTFLNGDTFRNTLSRTSYSISFLFKSAYDFCRSLAAFNLC